jgi:hypothetical protein
LLDFEEPDVYKTLIQEGIGETLPLNGSLVTVHLKIFSTENELLHEDEKLQFYLDDHLVFMALEELVTNSKFILNINSAKKRNCRS